MIMRGGVSSPGALEIQRELGLKVFPSAQVLDMGVEECDLTLKGLNCVFIADLLDFRGEKGFFSFAELALGFFEQ